MAVKWIPVETLLKKLRFVFLLVGKGEKQGLILRILSASLPRLWPQRGLHIFSLFPWLWAECIWLNMLDFIWKLWSLQYLCVPWNGNCCLASVVLYLKACNILWMRALGKRGLRLLSGPWANWGLVPHSVFLCVLVPSQFMPMYRLFAYGRSMST